MEPEDAGSSVDRGRARRIPADTFAGAEGLTGRSQVQGRRGDLRIQRGVLQRSAPRGACICRALVWRSVRARLLGGLRFAGWRVEASAVAFLKQDFLTV